MEDQPIKSPDSDDPVEAWLRSQVSRPVVSDGVFSAAVLAKIQAEQKAERRARYWTSLSWRIGLGIAALSLAAPLLRYDMTAIMSADQATSPLISGTGQLLMLGALALLYSYRHYLAGSLTQTSRAFRAIRLTY